MIVNPQILGSNHDCIVVTSFAMFYHIKKQITLPVCSTTLALTFLQSLGLRLWACKLAGMVELTGGNNFYIK